MQRDERHTQCRHYHTNADTNFHSSRIEPRDRTVYVSSSSSGLLGVTDTMVYVPSTYCETVSVSSRC
jgi:N-acetylmuramic acid 6-phosphate (MurNAc-6-P) etherase